jgi:hypothetical protein
MGLVEHQEQLDQQELEEHWDIMVLFMTPQLKPILV